MVSSSIYGIILGVIILAAISISGCAQNSNTGQILVPNASRDVANATADNILASMNSGNYSGYINNFSATVMAQVNESQYTYARNAVRDTFGDYVSRAGPVTSVYKGYNVFVYDCTFTKGHVKFVLAMNMTNTSSVEGVQFLKP